MRTMAKLSTDVKLMDETSLYVGVQDFVLGWD